MSENNSGGFSDYYLARVEKPQRPGQAPYVAECEDIIRALNMPWDMANQFKSLWRDSATKNGGCVKFGLSEIREADKRVHYATQQRRMLDPAPTPSVTVKVINNGNTHPDLNIEAFESQLSEKVVKMYGLHGGGFTADGPKPDVLPRDATICADPNCDRKRVWGEAYCGFHPVSQVQQPTPIPVPEVPRTSPVKLDDFAPPVMPVLASPPPPPPPPPAAPWPPALHDYQAPSLPTPVASTEEVVQTGFTASEPGDQARL